METYPVEYRQRVIAWAAEGMKSGKIAKALGVTASWVRWVKRLHRSGQPLEPKSRANQRRSLAQREGERLRARVAEHPGTTLEDLKRDLGLDVSITSIWNALKELGLSLKKNSPRRRAKPSGRCRRTRGLENPPNRHRSATPRFPRRNVWHDENDPPLRLGADGSTGARPGPAWPLAKHDFCRGPSTGRIVCSLGRRWGAQR